MTAAAQLDKIMIAQKTILFYLMLGICMKQGLGNFMHQMLELWIHELGSIVISPRGYRAERLNGKNILIYISINYNERGRDIRSISFREGRRDRTVWLADPSNFYSVKSAYGFLSEASSLGITSLYKKVCNKGFSYPIAQWLTSPFECLQAIGFVSASRLISKSVCFWLWHEDFEIFHYRLPAVA
ncbi:rhodanese domain-containing protein [Trifolium repens]|nr:rhodanese domain-containing protein [Trifolium repens]